MKKHIYISILVLFLSAIMNAQNEESFNPTKKGQFLIGATSSFGGGFYSSKTIADNVDDVDGTDSFSMSISPKGGYFIIDNLVTGLQFNIGIGNSTSKGANDIEYSSSTTQLSIAPYVSYYFGNNKIKPSNYELVVI